MTENIILMSYSDKPILSQATSKIDMPVNYQARIQTTSPVFWDTVRFARKNIEMYFPFLT